MGNQQESYLVPVPGFVGILTDCLGTIYSVRRGKLKALKNFQHGGKTRKIYFRVALAEQKIFVHRLIASVYYGSKIPSDLHVNHIDGDTENNCITNLEIVTHRENTKHAKENSLYCSGVAWHEARKSKILRDYPARE